MDLEQEQLAGILEGLGCPAEKCQLLASQLDKRARQLVEARGLTYPAAVQHLLHLMRQGWASPQNSDSPSVNKKAGP